MGQKKILYARKSVTILFPLWMVEAIDVLAIRNNRTRMGQIMMIIADKLSKERISKKEIEEKES